MDLFIFDGIKGDPIVNAILEKDNATLLRGIVRFAETEGVTEDSLREYIATLLANDENVLSMLARGQKRIGDDLYRLAMLDIETVFTRLFDTKIKYKPSGNSTGYYAGYTESIRKITSSNTPNELLENLLSHYSSLGNGLLSKYGASEKGAYR